LPLLVWFKVVREESETLIEAMFNSDKVLSSSAWLSPSWLRSCQTLRLEKTASEELMTPSLFRSYSLNSSVPVLLLLPNSSRACIQIP